MSFRGGEFSTGTTGNFQPELTFMPYPSSFHWLVFEPRLEGEPLTSPLGFPTASQMPPFKAITGSTFSEHPQRILSLWRGGYNAVWAG
jgi:hypothetical protein